MGATDGALVRLGRVGRALGAQERGEQPLELHRLPTHLTNQCSIGFEAGFQSRLLHFVLKRTDFQITGGIRSW